MARPLSTTSSTIFPVTGPSPKLISNASPHNSSAQLALMSRHFSIRIIRPIVSEGKKQYLHIGDLYLHFLDGLLVRQLEVFYSKSIPTKWAVRRHPEDDSLMYSYGFSAMSRFRSMSLSLEEFEAKWMEYTGEEGDFETRQSPILSPKNYKFSPMPGKSRASFNSMYAPNRPSSLSGTPRVRKSTMSQSSTTSSNSASQSSNSSSNTTCQGYTTSSNTPYLSNPASSSSPFSSKNPSSSKATPMVDSIGSTTTKNKPALPPRDSAFQFTQSDVIEMDTIELGPPRPPKMHSHQNPIPIPPGV